MYKGSCLKRSSDDAVNDAKNAKRQKRKDTANNRTQVRSDDPVNENEEFEYDPDKLLIIVEMATIYSLIHGHELERYIVSKRTRFWNRFIVVQHN